MAIFNSYVSYYQRVKRPQIQRSTQPFMAHSWRPHRNFSFCATSPALSMASKHPTRPRHLGTSQIKNSPKDLRRESIDYMCSNHHIRFVTFIIIWHYISTYGYGSIPMKIPFLGEWPSTHQLFWCSPGVQGFDTLPFKIYKYHIILMLHDHHGGWSSIVFPFPCPSTASCGEKGSPAASCERSSRSSCERFEGAPGLGNLEDKGVEEAMPKKKIWWYSL